MCVCCKPPAPTPSHQPYFVKSPGCVIYRPRPEKGPSTLSSTPSPGFLQTPLMFQPDPSPRRSRVHLCTVLFQGGMGSSGLGRGAPAQRHASVPGWSHRDFLGSCPPRGPCPHRTYPCSWWTGALGWYLHLSPSWVTAEFGQQIWSAGRIRLSGMQLLPE